MADSVGKISLDLELQGDLTKQINEAANKIGEQLKASLQGVNFNGIAESLSNSIKKSMESTMKGIQESLEKTINKALSGATSSSRKIKVPVSYDTPTNSAVPRTSTLGNVSPRAPPTTRVSSGVNFEAIKAQIDNLIQSLDITNAKIEQQKEKLQGLKEAYASTFNEAQKNKLQEQILKTEATINRLTAASDKAGFKLVDLDNSMNSLGNSTKKASSSVNTLGNTVKNSTSKASSGMNMISRMLDRMIIRMFLFNTVMKAITAFGSFLGSALMTNTQFANSLLQIKTNLEVAFMPIYQAVLPAINALMRGLNTVTAYIAAFVNTLFGKTYQASYGAAKSLNTSISKMKELGSQSKKTSSDIKKAAKEATGSLAGFDEINQLKMSTPTPSSGGASTPSMAAPNVDLSPQSAAMSKISSIANGVKKVLASIFKPMKLAWALAGAGVIAEFKRAVEGTKQTIKNFGIALSSPPFQKFIENVTRLILAIVKLGLRIYDGFILPVINWFISLLPGAASGLNPILEAVTRLVNYLSGDGFPIIQFVLSSIVGIIVGIKAFQIGKGILGIVDKIKNIGPALKGVWAILATNPIVLIISIIAGLIAAVVILYQTNETFRNKVNAVWASVRATFSSFGTWLKTAFSTDWTKRFGVFGEVLNGFFRNVKNIFNSVKQIFNGIINFIAGVFTGNWKRAWNGVKNIFAGIMNGLRSVIKSPLNAVISGINILIGGLNKIHFDVPSWVPGVGGKGFGISIPKVPYLAQGGIINQPTLAMVGEAGKEAVMPLENNTGWIDTLADKLVSKISGNNNSNSTDKDINLSLRIDFGGDKIYENIIRGINQKQRQAGRTLIRV